MIMSRGRLTFFMEILVLVGSHLSTETVPQVTTFLTRPKGLGKHLTFYNQNEMPVKQTNVLTNDSTAFVCNLSCHCLTCDSGMGPWHWYNFFTKWGLFCQKQISGTGTSNYIPRYLWDVITWYVPLVHKSTTTYSYVSRAVSTSLWLLFTHQDDFTGSILRPSLCRWRNPGYCF